MPDALTAGRFSAASRSMVEEDRLVLTTVGVDIGSSTSHLLFSRLELEREATRYVTTVRTVLHESDILLTPYLDDVTIDSAALGAFVSGQYRAAGIDREQVDTGALIMTGVALRRRNARAVADLFAAEAGRFVAVSAGDILEGTMAAHGSGAVAASLEHGCVLNIDIGGGTTKVVVCRAGRTTDLMAIDVGARLIAHDEAGVVTRLEPAGQATADRLGLEVSVGAPVSGEALQAMACALINELFTQLSAGGAASSPLLRTPPLRGIDGIHAVTVSGGVSEFVHGRARGSFGDLGPLLAAELRRRIQELGAPLLPTAGGIRATVLGASQHTIQVSGSTVYLSSPDVTPVRNVPVITPVFSWDSDDLASRIAAVVGDALARFELTAARTPVAVGVRWEGSATFGRIAAFCDGVARAMGRHLTAGHPLVLVFDSDIGGLVGLHLREELALDLPIISIDGVDLREFDYIDVGSLIPSSGAVPVVIKSLVFSGSDP